MYKQRADLTFKDNLQRSRHGWVRLTPAYSVQIVAQILDLHPNIQSVLEPFSGTGTTGLVMAQRGLNCDLYDINPFLVWLARVKCSNYTPEQLKATSTLTNDIINRSQKLSEETPLWIPPINFIERWWAPSHLHALTKIFDSLHYFLPEACAEKDLLLIAFCRLVLKWSNAAFNHQSMSFKQPTQQLSLFADDENIYQTFRGDVQEIVLEASDWIEGTVQVHLADSQIFPNPSSEYDAIITSPPYVNRMSYIRELRPYMYWLGYLTEAREAGELDWQAIGGTWGIATSRLNTWRTENTTFKLPALDSLLKEIAQSSTVLSNYVEKYFVDIAEHLSNAYRQVKPSGSIYYIVGNSKFYNTLIPVEVLYADLMQQAGFENPKIEIIRKRNSKQELLEFLVSADKPR
jgi:DNA modification methylase